MSWWWSWSACSPVAALVLVASWVVVRPPQTELCGLSFAGHDLVSAHVLARMVGRRVDRNQLGGGGHISPKRCEACCSMAIDRALEASQVDHRVGRPGKSTILGGSFKGRGLGTVWGQRVTVTCSPPTFSVRYFRDRRKPRR